MTQIATDKKLLFKEETFKILGACFEVYNEIGCGFLEPLYQGCLEIELNLQDIPFVPQNVLDLSYKGIILKHKYQPDFICFDKIVLEIKAVDKLIDEHRAQLINYLNAAKIKVGLLVNFGHYPKLGYERFIV